MAEDIKKKIQIVIETITEEAKSKIRELDRAIDDLNRKTSAKAPAQRTTRTTDIKANKEEAESLKLLRAEMKAYMTAANVLNKRELTRSVKSGMSSLPGSIKDTSIAVESFTKKVEESYKDIEKVMGPLSDKQREIFEQMVPEFKIKALKDYTSVTGKLGKQIDLTDASSRKFHYNLRKDITAALIAGHVLRILGNASKIIDVSMSSLAKTLGAFLDVLLMPALNVLEPFLEGIIWVTEALDGLGQGMKDLIFVGISFVGILFIIHKALQHLFGRGLWGTDAFKPIGGKTIFGWLGDKLKGKAAGGPVLGQGAYIVGEKGPEIFVPGQSGTIIPHDKIHRQEGGDVYAPIMGGLGGAAAGASLAYAFTGDPLVALAGGGLGAMFGYSLGGGDLSSVAETVGGGMSAIMENEGVQAVLSTMSIITSTIAAALAPIAPLLGAAGLLLGAVSIFGGRGGKGGGAVGVDGRIAAEATIDVGQVTNKTMVKQGIGSQTAINMGARGTTKMLTAILLRMNGCFAVCGMPVLGGKLDGAKGVLDKILPFIGGIGAAIAAWWASGFGKGSGEGTPSGVGVGMPEKEREEAGEGIAVAFVAYLEDQARIVARVIPVALATIEQYVKVKYLNPFVSTLSEIIQRVNLKWNTYTVPILRTLEERVNLVWNRWAEPIFAPLVRTIRFANAAVSDPYLTPLQRAIRFVNAVVTDPILTVLNRTIRYVNAAIVDPVLSTIYRTIYYVNSAVVDPIFTTIRRTVLYVNSTIVDPVVTAIKRPVEFINGLIVEPVVTSVKRTIEFVNGVITDPFTSPIQRAILFVNGAIVDPVITSITRTIQFVNGLITDPIMVPINRLIQFVNGVVVDPVLTGLTRAIGFINQSVVDPILLPLQRTIGFVNSAKVDPVLSAITRQIIFVNGLITDPTLLPLKRAIEFINNAIIDPVVTPITRTVNYVNATITDPIVIALKRTVEFVNSAIVDPIVLPIKRVIDFINNPIAEPTLNPLSWIINFIYSIPIVQPLLTTLEWIIDLVWKLPTPEQLYGDIQKNVSSIAAEINTEGQRIGNWLWDGIIAAIVAFVGFEASLSSKINEGIALVKDNQTLALAVSGAIGFIIASGLKIWESAQAALGAGSAIFGTVYRVIHDALVSLGINPNLEIDTSNVLVSLWGTGTTKAAPSIIDGLKNAIVSWWGSVFPPIVSTVSGGITSFLSGVFGGGSVAAQSDVTTAWKNLITNSSTNATVTQRPSFTELLKNMIIGGATDSTATSTPTFSSLLSNMVKNATVQAKPSLDAIWSSVYSVDAAKAAAQAAGNAAAIAEANAYGAAQAAQHGLVKTGTSATGVNLYRAPTLTEQVKGTLKSGEKYGYDYTGGSPEAFVISGSMIYYGQPAQMIIAAAQGKNGGYWDPQTNSILYPGMAGYNCKTAGKNALPGCTNGPALGTTVNPSSGGGTNASDPFIVRHGGWSKTLNATFPDGSEGDRVIAADGSYIDYTTSGAKYYDKAGKSVAASYQKGGFVSDTGMAFLHKGEFVLPKSEVDKQINNMSRGGDIIINNPVFQISGKTDRELFDSFLQRLKSEGRRLGGTV